MEFDPRNRSNTSSREEGLGEPGQERGIISPASLGLGGQTSAATEFSDGSLQNEDADSAQGTNSATGGSEFVPEESEDEQEDETSSGGSGSGDTTDGGSGGATESEEPDDEPTEECGAACYCAPGEDCRFRCTDESCKVFCFEGAICDIDPGGFRQVAIRCAAGAVCRTRPSQAEIVSFSCVGGGSCVTDCGSASNCTVQCQSPTRCRSDYSENALMTMICMPEKLKDCPAQRSKSCGMACDGALP
ncbi:MAG: hypothetical protein MK135_07515 [Polyangiaceae bacterium]|nr:hypothetical protein [Polyangiaceae bacterium]